MKFILQTDIDGTHEFVAGEAEEDAIAAYRANRKPTVLFSAEFSIARERPVVTRDFLVGPDPAVWNKYATDLDGFLE